MFPPSPPDNKLIADVINGYCDDITPESIKEDGCAVCACYTHSVIWQICLNQKLYGDLDYAWSDQKRKIKQMIHIWIVWSSDHDTLSNVAKTV